MLLQVRLRSGRRQCLGAGQGKRILSARFSRFLHTGRLKRRFRPPASSISHGRTRGIRCGCPGGPDSFNSLDSGWTNKYPTYDTFEADGTLKCTSSGGIPGTWSTLYRTSSITPANLKVIVESLVYHNANSATTGIFFVDGNAFRIFARWPFESVGMYAFGSFVSVNFNVQSGAKLTLRVEHVSGYQYRACFFVNSGLVHQATGNWTFSSSERHGVTCTPWTPSLPAITGQWDNYACHIGNP